MPAKKRRISGFGGLELLTACQSLKSLRETVIFEEREMIADDGAKDFAEVLEELIGMMKERINGSQAGLSTSACGPPHRSVQSFSFSSLTIENLTKWNTYLAGTLLLKEDVERRQRFLGRMTFGLQIICMLTCGAYMFFLMQNLAAGMRCVAFEQTACLQAIP